MILINNSKINFNIFSLKNYLNIMKTIMTIVTQKIDIPHPMYVTTESAVDSDVESCYRITQVAL